MTDCERYEILVSSWIDDELDRSDESEMLDHLARCPDCREFYIGARSLAGLVAVVGTASKAELAPPEVWKRIETEAVSRRLSGAGRTSGRPRRHLPVWARQTAAAVVLAVSLGALLWKARPAVVPRPLDAIVNLGEDRGRMSNTRFVELTKEVLRADRKYQVALYQVMDQVVRDTRALEDSWEDPPSHREPPVERELPETVRGPA